MPFRRRPQSLVGILLTTYWTAFADDPLSALLSGGWGFESLAARSFRRPGPGVHLRAGSD
jgi:hypothetical protein